jgi:hypothetical protein
MLFVDELDGDDGLGRVVRDGFANATGSRLANVSCNREKHVATYEAYAPCPMVLLTSLKGKSDGRGAIWLLGGAGPIMSNVQGRRGR